MCSDSSAWQRIDNRKRDPESVKKEYTRAMGHIRSCLELYALQVAPGRYLLHEHPARASSFQEDAVREMAGFATVSVAVGDQCQ